jgi:recombination protein RecA
MAKKKATFSELLEEQFEDDFHTVDSEITIDAIRTGSVSLDVSTGIGGVPRGKFTEIYGSESVGKTTLALSISKQAILAGLNVLIVDMENTLTLQYIRLTIGEFDASKLTLIQPETAEQAFQLCEAGIVSGEFGLIILDSIGALAPEEEKEKEYTESTMALVSRLLSKFLRRNAYAVRTNNIAFVFINQVRDQIGSYIKSYSTPGGHALKHFSSLRIQLGVSNKIEVTDQKEKKQLGIQVSFTIKKNKLSAPGRSFSFPIIFNIGVDTTRDMILFAETMGILGKRGSFYTFEEETIGQGMVNTMDKINSDKLLLDKISKACYDMLSNEKLEIKDENAEKLEDGEDL